MRLPFRRRLFLGLVLLGTAPLAATLLVLTLQQRSGGSSAGPRAALEAVAMSGRAVFATLDTLQLDEAARAALETHAQTITRGTTLARRAETLTRFAAGFLALIYLLAALVLVAVSLQLARRWSRYFSAPIEELTGWVQRIQRREPLPDHAENVGAPEFESLQSALREMSEVLEHARLQELERERLVAFRETARRVAHEIRGPLTSSRLALDLLERAADGSSVSAPAVQVLGDEVRRLEQMAKEFSEFGRLPEGPEAEIDIGQLLDGVIQATVPAGIPVQRVTEGDLVVRGHYEPLRRAVQNLLRNAIDVTSEEGITVRASRTENGVTLSIGDHGPGVDPEVRDRIFEPYFTTKESGSGLGLAIVRQTVQAHGGTVSIDDTPGGGATFTIRLPATS
jgi:signal transduction histidine kinase